MLAVVLILATCAPVAKGAIIEGDLFYLNYAHA